MVNTGVGDLYAARLARGEIEPDPAQRRAVEHLAALAARLASRGPPRSRLLSKLARRPRADAPRGLYLHGQVGRGKTMLMDLFFEAVPFSPKRRVHFHEFMAGVHDEIAVARGSTEGDPIPAVAWSLAANARLLCLDELHVTDIADAMILGRLFSALFEADVVLVATSNAAPCDLYRDGLNRQLFLPFIELLEARADGIELTSAKDYRLDKLRGRPLYFTPANAAARRELDVLWDRLTGRHPAEAVELAVKGRKLKVPLASMGVARFSFAGLCEQPLAPVDYLAIAHTFHTVIVDGIPTLSPSQRDRTRRLINLIDTLYDNAACFIASAEAEPGELCPAGPLSSMFERTASRLIEMRSEDYLRRRHAAHGATARARQETA